MEKVFTLTTEIMEKAQTYMPIETKCELAEQIAQLCIRDLSVDKQNKPAEKLISMPCIQGEDMALKSILLQNTLLSFYLGIENTRTKTREEMYERYDYYAGGNLLNQLERFKGDTALKNKAFDLINDYKEFKKIVDTEIFNIKTNKNDLVGRLLSAIEILSTPDNIKALKEEIEKLPIKKTSKETVSQ